MNNTTRFTGRATDYAQARPGYPAALLELLRAEGRLPADAVIADVGSGTGLLAELFLQAGHAVLGVEPNPEMRSAAETALKPYPAFTSVAATAEATTLATGSLDLITVGQALHWFDPAATRQEFTRILRPGGGVVLAWNRPCVDSTPFMRDLATVWNTYLFDLAADTDTGLIESFFAGHPYVSRSVPNRGLARTREQLLGGFRSSSHAPRPGEPAYPAMEAAVHQLFAAHQQAGRVTLDYDTAVIWGSFT